MHTKITISLQVSFHTLFCYFSIIGISLLLVSCGTSRSATASARPVIQLWDSLGMDHSHHTGISVFDVPQNRYILQVNDQKYFTPASNTKFLTLVTALETFDDHIPALYYTRERDTLFIWGGGDPGVFYPSLRDTAAIIRFLKNSDIPIVLSDHHFQTTRYGRGWAWDDYPYRFQTERNALPVYGNKLWVERKHDTITVVPSYFDNFLQIKKDTSESLTRNESGTQYTYKYDVKATSGKASVPVSIYPRDTREIWSSLTEKNIILQKIPFRGGLEVEGTSLDTLAKYIMRDSDNFMAEHLLLACALKTLGMMDEHAMIRYMLQGTLANLPDSVRWVDGSGVSRYNQITPRSVMWMMQFLLKEKGPDYFKDIFAAGGKSGTLKGWITAPGGEPFIFAKSGTHRNTFNLSGLLITKKGNLLLFSWMNNHFLNRQEVERKMEIFLQRLYDQY